MTGYLLKRLAQLFPVVLIIVVVNFFLIRLAPGDPVMYLIGDVPVSEEHVAQLRHQLALDEPLLKQLFVYLANVVRGDFGYSYVSRAPVLDVIFARIPATLLLTITQYLLAIIGGIVLGVVSAKRQGSIIDTGTTLFSLVGYAIPVFWLGQMLMLIFAMKLKLFPAQGMLSLRYNLGWVQEMIDILHHLVLPLITLTFFNLALITRLTRANMLQVLRLEYIIFARSKGLSERAVVFKHAMRNALFPVVTIIGLNLKNLITGAVLTETVFAWPGLGRLTFDAIRARDYPVLMGMFVFVGIIVILANLITDIAYAYLDPRIKYK